ncbi:ABC transporter permease [Mycoplasmatota bacterium zrk1]
MFKRLINNFKKDWLRGYRHFYLLITIATALLFSAFLLFVLPDGYSTPDVYQYVDSSIGEPMFDAEEGITFVDSKEEIKKKMKEDANSYGVAVELIDSEPVVTIYTQSNAEGEFGQTLKMMLSRALSLGEEFEYTERYESVVLHEEFKDVKYKETFLPVLIVMDSAMIGMFLLSVMLFTEKDHKMHTAYMVSPGGLTEHLLSKSMVMLVLSLISGTIMTLIVRGFDANFLYLYIVLIPGAFFGGTLGLFLGSVFKNVQKSMLGLIFLMIGLMLPTVSYMFPSFSPMWIKFIPTYQMIYGVRAAVIPLYGFDDVWRNAVIVLAEGIVLFGISRYLYQRALYKNS